MFFVPSDDIITRDSVVHAGPQREGEEEYNVVKFLIAHA